MGMMDFIKGSPLAKAARFAVGSVGAVVVEAINASDNIVNAARALKAGDIEKAKNEGWTAVSKTAGFIGGAALAFWGAGAAAAGVGAVAAAIGVGAPALLAIAGGAVVVGLGAYAGSMLAPVFRVSHTTGAIAGGLLALGGIALAVATAPAWATAAAIGIATSAAVIGVGLAGSYVGEVIKEKITGYESKDTPVSDAIGSWVADKLLPVPNGPGGTDLKTAVGPGAPRVAAAAGTTNQVGPRVDAASTAPLSAPAATNSEVTGARVGEPAAVANRLPASEPGARITSNDYSQLDALTAPARPKLPERTDTATTAAPADTAPIARVPATVPAVVAATTTAPVTEKRKLAPFKPH